MKTWIIIAIVIAVIGGGVFIVTRANSDNSAKITNTHTGASQQIKTGEDAFVAVDACDVLTQAAATEVLGTGAEKSDTSAGNASSDDVSVSNCNYTLKPTGTAVGIETAKNTSVAGVLARAAKTHAGAESNQAAFAAQKPAGVTDVSGYGDKAFFNPQFGQLNILKGNNWYIMSTYKGIKATAATLDDDKKLADAIANNLK